LIGQAGKIIWSAVVGWQISTVLSTNLRSLMAIPAARWPRPWKVAARRLLLAAEPWLSVYQEQVELPTGRSIDDFYRVVLPDFAVVVPITITGQVVMVRGYKHGLGRVTLSPPAGLIDRGEEPIAAARRELLEETGYAADDWRPIGRYVVDGNRQCGTMHAFLARGAALVRPPAMDECEELCVEMFDRETLVAALKAGEIGNLAGAGSVALALLLAD
jgi:ADP-ribose pyrophosphatase